MHDNTAKSSSNNNDNKDLIVALSAWIKAVALMARMPAPPGSCHTLFLDKYSGLALEKALGKSSTSVGKFHVTDIAYI